MHVVNEDFEDNKILECALAAGADIIVSGDKHSSSNFANLEKPKYLRPESFSIASKEVSRAPIRLFDQMSLVAIIKIVANEYAEITHPNAETVAPMST